MPLKNNGQVHGAPAVQCFHIPRNPVRRVIGATFNCKEG
jgi:hypothetical protein